MTPIRPREKAGTRRSAQVTLGAAVPTEASSGAHRPVAPTEVKAGANRPTDDPSLEVPEA